MQYAKRMVGKSMTNTQSTHLPLKINSGGVMPVIFASSILSAPLLLQKVSSSGPARSKIRSISVACFSGLHRLSLRMC